MNIEQNSNSHEFHQETDEQIKEALESIARSLKEDKLYCDAVNVWQAVIAPSDFNKIKKAEHYEQYIRRKNTPPVADLIMELSDFEAVAAFDQVVDDFNADLERIKREKDKEAREQFAKKGAKIAYQKR